MADAEILFSSTSNDVHIPTDVPLHDFICNDIPVNCVDIALVNGISGDCTSYSQLKALVANVACGLYNLGIRKGDVVMLLLSNCPEFPILFLGITSIGAIVTTANPSYGKDEIYRQTVDSSTKLIVTVPSLAENVVGLNSLTVFLEDNPSGKLSVRHLFQSDGTKAPKVKISSSDTCALPYSSGTTGLSKGVMLTHFNLVSNIAQHLMGTCPRIDYRSSDVVLGVLPMFHIYSITCVTLCALKARTTIVTMPRFNLELLLQLADKYKISVAPIVPPIILLLTKSPEVQANAWKSLRMVISGAAPLDSELEKAFKHKFKNVITGQGYGMTELSPVASLSFSLQKGGGPTCFGSAGALIPNTQAKIVDTSTGQSLGPNKRGELWIRGPQTMKGYLNNPKATAMTLDSSGWLKTGDIAYFDEDGNMFVVDRVKELIKVKGFQVPPAELEGILISHPDIADAAVIGKPDTESGELPVAFVVKASRNSSLTKAEVIQFVAKQVVSYKKLHAVHFVDAVPKSASGKILRRQLKSKL